MHSKKRSSQTPRETCATLPAVTLPDAGAALAFWWSCCRAGSERLARAEPRGACRGEGPFGAAGGTVWPAPHTQRVFRSRGGGVWSQSVLPGTSPRTWLDLGWVPAPSRVPMELPRSLLTACVELGVCPVDFVPTHLPLPWDLVCGPPSARRWLRVGGRYGMAGRVSFEVTFLAATSKVTPDR